MFWYNLRIYHDVYHIVGRVSRYILPKHTPTVLYHPTGCNWVSGSKCDTPDKDCDELCVTVLKGKKTYLDFFRFMPSFCRFPQPTQG